MRRAAVVTIAALWLSGVLLPGRASAQRAQASGVAHTEAGPLARVRVQVRRADTLRYQAYTNDAGRFSLALDTGRYAFTFTHIGYAQRVMDVVVAAPSVALDVAMLPLAVNLNPLVVSALKRTEKALDAPVSIAVVDEQAIQERTAVSPLEYVDAIPGVSMAQQGIESRQVVARGFNQTFGTSLLMMTDYRIAAVPSLRANLAQFITPTAEDLDRIEVLRGPASALYGPNAADGVVHFISRSPLDAPGTSLSLVGGSRNLFQASFRSAAAPSDAIALKLSGTYFRGREWDAPVSGELAPRDPVAERRNAEARMDVRVTPTATAVVTLGSSLDKRHVEYTSIGTSQIRNWRYDFAQLRYTDRRFFAQAYVNINDAGQTRSLNTLELVHDNSTYIVGQVQHGFDVGVHSTITYGLDVSRTNPITGGSINGRNEETDVTLGTGVYAQAENRLTPELQLHTALRADRNDRISGVQVSPRVALQYAPGEGHRYRISYNRAFAEPTNTDLFVDIVAAKLGPLPFNIRAVGVPQDGFHFPQGCGGPCMISPFAAGQLPLDATPLWPAVVAVMKAGGVDLSGIPAPAARDVPTVLRTLDPAAGAFRKYAGTFADIAALGPTITNSLELGYKSLIADRFLLDVSVYGERRDDFRGPLAVVTPNAFLATPELSAYLARYMPKAQADQLGAVIGGVDGNGALTGIPVGTVSPEGRLGGSDIMLTYRNFGRAELWGADLSAELLATERISVRGGYSYVSRNYFPSSSPSEPDLSMNSPRNSLSFGARYRDAAHSRSAEVRGRYADGFRMVDGVWMGDVPAFTTVDVEAGTALPAIRDVRVVVTAQNVLGHKHAEFVGAPVIGRLVLTRLQYSF